VHLLKVARRNHQIAKRGQEGKKLNLTFVQVFLKKVDTLLTLLYTKNTALTIVHFSVT
jgi:hypothetical protein